MNTYFITGNGTGIGKTFVSAILAEAFYADYWKPVQAGNLEHTDSMIVRGLLGNPKTVIHPEVYRFKRAMSPHAAAKYEGLEINPDSIRMPASNNHLLIEGAGGLMVPLNSDYLVIDLVQRFNVPIILVSGIYLGSINHTLLSFEALRKRNITVTGIFFNGAPNPDSESFILRYSRLPLLGRIEQEPVINKNTILKYAEKFREEISLFDKQ